MTFVKANISRCSLNYLLIALCFILSYSAVAMGQGEDPAYVEEDPAYIEEEFPPWADDDEAWTNYNYSVGIDVLLNDFEGNLPIDCSTLTIVSQPAYGEVDVDPILGLIVYTPNQNFAGYDQFQYKVADSAGNFSNIATVGVWVNNDPPEITLDDYYVESGNLWVFHGTVTDENPGVCRVTFGGILDGETADVDQSGEYFLYVEIETGVMGMVTAQATDEIGEVSNVEEDYFFQY